nr:hypothetical protein [Paenibacillus maysiensis]
MTQQERSKTVNDIKQLKNGIAVPTVPATVHGKAQTGSHWLCDLPIPLCYTTG